MSADSDMVENAARAIRNRAEQPIDMAEARYLARAALDASGIGELVEALAEARGALETVVGGALDVSNTAIIVGNGADTVMRQISSAITMVDAALSRARATQPPSGDS
jgi:hypothetical protein